MIKSFRLLLTLVGALACTIAYAQYSDKDIVFVCPPCGCAGDHVYDESPGACSSCNMAQIATYKGMEASKPGHSTSSDQRKKVAIFIFDGVQIIDYTGPYEVFGQAGWQVFTVSQSGEPITTAMGMKVIPAYSFDNAPQADIVVLPGGGVGRHQGNEKVLGWVKKSVAESETALSVCNGAFFLAKAGLLDGRQATTFASLIPSLQQLAPKADIVTDQRYVDNGKIVTSAGLSSGIDASLHVVSKHLGLGRTQEIATNLEYDWDPEGNYVRAALADKYLNDVRNILYQFEHQTLRFEGNREYWKSQYKVETNLSKDDLQRLIHAQLEKAEGWQKSGTNGKYTVWSVPVSGAENWKGYFSIEEEDAAKLVTFKLVKRAPSPAD